MDDCKAVVNTVRVLRDLNPFWDCLVESHEGQQFRAHRALLAACSPVWIAALEHDNQPRERLILPLSCNTETTKLLLDFVYEGKLPSITEANIQLLYDLADMYDMDGLRQRINWAVDEYSEQLVNTQNVNEFGQLALAQSLKLTGKVCRSILDEHKSVVKESFELRQLFHNLTPPRIFVIGGDTKSGFENSVEVFDFEANTWSKISNLPAPRAALTVVVANTRMFAIGGGGHSQPSISDVDEYDFLENCWRAVVGMNQVRAYSTACNIDEKLYVVGGSSQSYHIGRKTDRLLNSIESFDLLTNEWILLPSTMSIARFRFDIGVIEKRFLYVVGGHNDVEALSTIERYDTRTGQWSGAPSMRYCRDGVCVAVLEEKIYAIGGIQDGLEYLKSVEVYDPSSSQWSEVAELNVARYGARAIAHNGKIYVIGGCSSWESESYQNTIEIFDSQANIWKMSTAQMSVGRTFAGIALF